MDGIGVKEEAGNNLGCVPSPYVLDNSGDQISQIPMADSAQKKKNLQREAQRKAQRRCRDRQRRTRDEERQQHAKIREELKQEQRKIEMQNRELLQLREQERQLISRVEKSEEHNKVLRSSNEALQRSLDLLCQNTHGVDPRLNRQPRIGSVAPSPTGSQSGHEDLMSLRNLRCFPYLPGNPRFKLSSMMSPISPLPDSETSQARSPFTNKVTLPIQSYPSPSIPNDQNANIDTNGLEKYDNIKEVG